MPGFRRTRGRGLDFGPVLRFTPLPLVLLLACAGPGSTQQPPPGAGPVASDGGDAPTVVDSSEAGEGAAKPVPGPELPTGARCDSNADCGAEELCEGIGCGAQEGRCVTNARMCTRDLATYCGCDGSEFQSSGSCPGQRFAYRGSCTPQLADGERCSDGRQCASGQCLGEGLEGCTAGAFGRCGMAACTEDLALYCGCNAVEFQGSGTCPNRQFAYRGPCE